MRDGVRRLHIYRGLFYPFDAVASRQGMEKKGGSVFGIETGRRVPKLSGIVLAVSVVDRPCEIQRVDFSQKSNF